VEDVRDLERRMVDLKNPGPGDELDRRALEYQQKHDGMTYGEALRCVLAEDPDLKKRFFEVSFSEETRTQRTK
jgi:hypothetical protein